MLPDTLDAIMPQNSNMENMPDIPTFRLVKKSQTNLIQDEGHVKKFIADGKTQKVSEEEKYGTRGKAGMKGNPLARGGDITKSQTYLDDDDDMDFNEEMFEPLSSSAVTFSSPSMEWKPSSDQLPNSHIHPMSSTPVKNEPPQVTPRKTTPVPSPRSAKSTEVKSQTDVWNPQGTNTRQTDMSFEDNFVPRELETPPATIPRMIVPRKKAKAPPPPPQSKTPVQNEIKVDSKQVTADTEQRSVRPKHPDASISDVSSVSSQLTEAEEFERIINEPQNEEFQVHVSSLANIDPDMLSLLSEEGVDAVPNRVHSSSTSSVGSHTDDNLGRNSFDNLDEQQKKGQPNLQKQQKNEKVQEEMNEKPEISSSSPSATVPAQTTASSYRAGYLAMLSQLQGWDSSESLDKVDYNSSESGSTTPQESPIITRSEKHIPQKPSEESSNVIPDVSLPKPSQMSSNIPHEDASLPEPAEASPKDSPKEVSLPEPSEESTNATQTTASSYRAGYLAMLSQLQAWDNSESLDKVGRESSESDTSTPHESPPGTPVLKHPPQGPAGKTSNVTLKDGSLPGPSTQPATRHRNVSSSSLCSDTDHEVQTRTASFSSEMSEDNVVSGRVEPSSIPSESLKKEPEEIPRAEAPEHERVEAIMETQEKNIVVEERLSSTSSTNSIGDISKPSEMKEEVSGTGEVPEVTMKETVNYQSITPQVQAMRRDSTSSQSNVDSEGDGHEDHREKIIGAQTITERVETEVLEAPLPELNIPKEETHRIPNGSMDTASDATSDKESLARKGSVSSESSNDSLAKAEHLRLSAQVPQQKSQKAIESHLEAAFADLDLESKKIESPVVETSSDHNSSKASSVSEPETWEYKIPEPPTPFKDIPASRFTDESSSVMSVPEVLSDVPSGFTDSPRSSIAEAKVVVRKNETSKVSEDVTDSFSSASSRRSSTSSISTTNNKFDGKTKQNVINELKSALKESNNNEPRIIELKPKVKSPEPALPPPAANMNIETMSEVLPVRANFPVQYSSAPRTTTARTNSMDTESKPLDPSKFIKPRLDSLSSYESCQTSEVESKDRSESESSSRDRSSSNESFESAPPPVPEVPPPSDSDIEVRPLRSSSDTSSSSHESETVDKFGITKAPVMKFSISTYTSRAEETSYEKKIAKSESFSHLVRPKMEASKPQMLKAESCSSLLPSDQSDTSSAETLPKVSEENVKNAAPEVQTKPASPEKPVIIEATLKPSQLFAKPLPPSKPASLSRINSFNSERNLYRSGSIEGRFHHPEPYRPPRRLQRSDSQEGLGRTNSMHNLATPSFDLRKAQSSYDLSYGSSSGSNGGGGMPGMPGMPGMMMGMPSMFGGGGMMPNDAGLEGEFMKLQQDFFKWQQQLLQNQHVLHSRVAPLASNPPQLQSVGVLRDIMGQTPNDNGGVAEAYNPTMAPPPQPQAPQPPRERIITIRMEGADGETDETKVASQPAPRPSMASVTQDMGRLNTGQQPRPNTQPQRRWGEEPSVSVGSWVERPSQPVGVYQDQDYTTSAPRMEEPRVMQMTFAQPQPSQTFAQPQPSQTFVQPQPSQTFVQPQPSQTFVQPQPSQAYVQPQQTQGFAQPQPSQPQQLHNLSPQQQQQFVQFLQQQQQQQPQQQTVQQQQPEFRVPQQQQRPAPQFVQPTQPKQPSPPFMQLQKQPSPSPVFVQAQQKQPSPSPVFMQAQQKQPPATVPAFIQPQTKQPSPVPAFKQQQPKQPSPPFMQPQQKQPSPQPQQQKQPSPPRMQKQPSPPHLQAQQEQQQQQDRAAFWRELESKRQDFGLEEEASEEPTRPPRRNSRQESPPQEFGQAVIHEPPPTYYYNGDGSSIAAVPGEREASPRYTSVVTLSNDRGEEGVATAPKDKVRSVVQLNNDQRAQPRPSPVVRGFRQPGEEPPTQGTFHSKIISGALKGQQPQQRTSVSPPNVSSMPAPLAAPMPQAPTAARLVAAVSQSQPKTPSPPRQSPSRTSPPRVSPPRASPPSGPAFQHVQLRPVGSRGSTPPEELPSPPAPVPMAPPAPMAAPVPMAPPAPMIPQAPMAPPPPPAPSNLGGMPPPPPPPPMGPPPPPAPPANNGERRTASGKRIVSPKSGPSLDPRTELMMAIKNHGGQKALRQTHHMINH